MNILLRELSRLTLAIFLVLLITGPILGQPPTTINSSADQKKTNDEPDPLLLDSKKNSEFVRTDGTKFRLKDLERKVVLVNLLATWACSCACSSACLETHA